MPSRYGGITGNVEISEDYGNINTAFENVEADVDAKAQIVTDHINDNVRHVTEAEHTKLTSVQEGAEPNQNAFSHVNNIDATAKTDTLTIAQGTGIAITTNPTTKTLTITATGEATPGAHGTSHNIDGSDPIPDLVTLRDDFDTLDGDFTAHLAETAADGAHGLDATVAKFKAGNGTFTDDDTSQTFTDAFCTTTSLVTISITSVTPPQGVWSVESADGSFTITSTKAESADITFDYYITRTV